MVFINPIEILELQEVDFVTIDNTLIKKAKRKLFADIHLSEDGHYTYKGIKITKSDCERAIIELDDNEKKEFYFFIVNNKALNDFLSERDESIFLSFKQESMYQIPAFKEFVSPYYSIQFDKCLQKAFKNKDARKLQSILRTQILINQSEINLAFGGVSKEIQRRIENCKELTEQITNDTSWYGEDSIHEVVEIVHNDFPFEILNILPASYFQSQVNKVAIAINYLQLAVDEKFQTTKVPLDLIDHVLLLNVESVSKPTFIKNQEILKKRHQHKLDQEKHAPEIKIWAGIVKDIHNYRDKIDKKEIKPKEAIINVISLFNLEELNGLAGFADEIRNQVARAYKSLSVSIWNTYSDIDNSISLVEKARLIKADSDTKKEIGEAMKQLLELKEKKLSGEKDEIQGMIKFVANINSQIQMHGMVNIKADKVKEMLNTMFSDEIINDLSLSNEIELKRRVYDQLEKVLVKLDAFYTNAFLKKIRPMANNDGELAVRIEKGISGFEFKAKNVANNVGTGLGKANDAMVRNLPGRIVGIIYLLIIMAIIALIGALFQGC
jgi:hypothetical protein